MVYKKAALVRRLIFITLPDRSRRAFTWARLPEFSGHLRDTMSTKIDCVIYLKSKLESEFTKLSIGKTPDTTSPRVSPRFPRPRNASLSRPGAISARVSMISRLDTLFLTMPIAWKGTLAQYAGRLHRLHDAKREVIIYDYVDMSVPVLPRMAAKRRVGYQTIGYRILGTGDLFSDQSVASEASGEAPATFSV